MNCAEHINAQAQWLFERDDIGAKTRLKLFRDMLQILCKPHIGEPDTKEFEKANLKLHQFLAVHRESLP